MIRYKIIQNIKASNSFENENRNSLEVYLFRKCLITIYHEYLNTELDIDSFKTERRNKTVLIQEQME